MNHSPRPASPRPVGAPLPAASLRSVILALLFALGAAVCGAAAAQSTPSDPPGRVARLSETSGSAWFFHPDNGDWAQAVRNLPLTTGDRLATDPNGRAELQVGSTTVRLDGGSELEVVALDDARIALQLHGGTLAVRVRNAAEAGQVDVSTDDGRFLVLRAGTYRFDRGTRSSTVAVESGEVRYEFSTSALNIGAGQRGEFWLDAAGAAQYALLAPVADAFTAWNADRDRAFDRSVATRYVSPEMTGAEDLDRYGAWEQTPDYGAVWYPTTVAADWAPYSAGRWAWVQPWGWTWVDDAPWGFAPFHYGRWVNVRNRWCWSPGARQSRPVWAPALVGWVGGGPPVGGPRGGGPAIGWFPLGPREVFVPGYAATPRYVRYLNDSHVRNPALVTAALNDPRSMRDFENRRFPHAVTFVPATVLTERRPIGPPVGAFRNEPWARDFAQRGMPGLSVSVAPPAAPPGLSGGFRGGDARRPPGPPPGFPAVRQGDRRDAFAERDAQRPGVLPAEVGGAPPRFERDRGRDWDRNRGAAPDRPGTPGWRGPDGGRPGPSSDPRNGTPPPSVAPVNPALQAPATAGTGGPPPGWNRDYPQGQAPGGGSERGPQGGPPQNRGARDAGFPPPGVAPAGATPPADTSQSPRMRILPVRRGDDPRIRDESAPPQARPEPVPGPRPSAGLPPPMVAPVRPVEPPRPVERPAPAQPSRPEVAAPRAPEQSPRLAPPRGVEPAAPRPAESQRQGPAESPRVGAPDRRNDGERTR